MAIPVVYRHNFNIKWRDDMKLGGRKQGDWYLSSVACRSMVRSPGPATALRAPAL